MADASESSSGSKASGGVAASPGTAANWLTLWSNTWCRCWSISRSTWATTSSPNWAPRRVNSLGVEIFLDVFGDLPADRRGGDDFGHDRLGGRRAGGRNAAGWAACAVRCPSGLRRALLGGATQEIVDLVGRVLGNRPRRLLRTRPAGRRLRLLHVRQQLGDRHDHDDERSPGRPMALIRSASMAASRGASGIHPVLLVFRPVAVMPALAIDERMSVSAWMLRSL